MIILKVTISKKVEKSNSSPILSLPSMRCLESRKKSTWSCQKSI
jgi:hypothetical protein